METLGKLLGILAVVPAALVLGLLITGFVLSTGSTTVIMVVISATLTLFISYAIERSRDNGASLRPKGLSMDKLQSHVLTSDTGNAAMLSEYASLIRQLDRREDRPKEGENLEQLVSLVLRQEGYEVLDRARLESRDGASVAFDFVAKKGDVALVIEAKQRTVASPDIDSFLLRLGEVNLPSLAGTGKVVPMLVVKDYTRAVRDTARTHGVKIVLSEALAQKREFPPIA